MKYKNLKSILVFALFISSCASTEHIVHPEPTTPVAKELPSSGVATVSDNEPAIKTVPLAPIVVAPAITEGAAKIPTAETKPLTPLIATVKAHHEAPVGVNPEQALKWLKNGNRRFTKGFFRNDGASAKDIVRLAGGQKPHSIILSCSDSRVPPEVIFDQKLGEVFVVRTAGEALDSSAIASIEYAVEHLGSRNILVMGHSQCGAVKAALATMDGQDAGSPNLNKLVADIHPRLAAFSGKSASANYVDEGWANTTGVAKDLLERSAIIADKVKSGDVQITTALYHLETGKAEFSH